MTTENIGERGLIEEIRKVIGDPGDRTLVGIGDDAAVLQANSGALVMTTDTFNEWVHFRIDHIAPDQLGAKMLTATVSDCAAMGCTPRWVTVSVAAIEETAAERILSMYHGMKAAADRYGCEIVGGDTVRAMSDLSVSITAIGEPLGSKLFMRSGAKPGDDIYVTGALGGAAAGLALMNVDPQLSLDEKYTAAMERYLAPEARIDVARILSNGFPVTSMIDISDGISVELNHLRRASGVSFHIDAGSIPVLQCAVDIAGDLELPAETLVYHGGEEFELLFTAEPGCEDQLIDMIATETAVPVSRIGTVMPPGDGVMLISPDGDAVPLTEEGYEHFAEE